MSWRRWQAVDLVLPGRAMLPSDQDSAQSIVAGPLLLQPLQGSAEALQACSKIEVILAGIALVLAAAIPGIGNCGGQAA